MWEELYENDKKPYSIGHSGMARSGRVYLMCNQECSESVLERSFMC